MIKKVFNHNYLPLFFALTSVAVLCVAFFSHHLVDSFMESSERNLTARLCEISRRLASLVTAQELARYNTAEDMKRPDYQALRQKLLNFAEESGVLYVYYMRVEDGQFQYIIDNDFDEATRVGLDTPAEPITELPLLSKALDGSVVVSTLGEYATGWEGLLSAYAPVYDLKNRLVAYAGADIHDESIRKSRKMVHILRVLEVVAVLAVFICGWYGFKHFRREANAAKAATVAKNKFLFHMSHEIRTPMNAIIGLSEQAEKNYGRPEALECLSVIKRAGRSLLVILNDILDFSKIESGILQIGSSPYQTSPLFDDLLALTRTKIADKDIELISGISPEFPASLIGDESRVREILLNLLSNAAKYTEKGFIRFSAVSRPDDSGQVILTFTVADSGIGIRRNDLPRLFSDFCRLDDRLAVGVDGTGLGLAITRGLCQAMGGDVYVDSQFRVGSTFTAVIRQWVGPEARTLGGHVAEAGEQDEIKYFTAPEFRVLVVDDNEINLIVAEGLLRPYAMQTTFCLSGKEALKKLIEHDYGLVLMDHIMPGMDGLETVAVIRAMGGRFATLPIIAVTANAMAGMEELFLKNGFDDFLTKPLEIQKLHALLEKWVPRRGGKAVEKAA